MKASISEKLRLNKNTISYLTDGEMSHVKGGFTYSLSGGHICQNSNAAYKNLQAETYGGAAPANGFECRNLIENNGTSTLSPEQI